MIWRVFSKKVSINKKTSYICNPKRVRGTIAQMVEQRTENPCVTGSIPVGTTKKTTWSIYFKKFLKPSDFPRAFLFSFL